MVQEELLEMHAIFNGRVQGVGFRYTTNIFAKKLGLNGTVRNLSDGTVEIFVQGSENKLKDLIKKLCEEFDLDPEKAVSLEFSSISRRYEDFRIL